MSETKWLPGQRAVIDRQRVVTIDRVTLAGRAIVGERTFNPDGIERVSSNRRSKLELLTPEIESEMALVQRGQEASTDAYKAVGKAERWLRDAFGGWGRRVPDSADVATAERLAIAIKQAMEDQP